MKTAAEILKEYVQFEDVNQEESVELLPLTFVDCMEEHSAQQSIAFMEWYLKSGHTLHEGNIEELYDKFLEGQQ